MRIVGLIGMAVIAAASQGGAGSMHSDVSTLTPLMPDYEVSAKRETHPGIAQIATRQPGTANGQFPEYVSWPPDNCRCNNDQLWLGRNCESANDRPWYDKCERISFGRRTHDVQHKWHECPPTSVCKENDRPDLDGRWGAHCESRPDDGDQAMSGDSSGGAGGSGDEEMVADLSSQFQRWGTSSGWTPQYGSMDYDYYHQTRPLGVFDNAAVSAVLAGPMGSRSSKSVSKMLATLVRGSETAVLCAWDAEDGTKQRCHPQGRWDLRPTDLIIWSMAIVGPLVRYSVLFTISVPRATIGP